MGVDVVIIMGSKSDLDFSRKIARTLEKFGIKYVMRVASAHKTPEKVLEILREYPNAVFITVAGRSNALSGFVDANVTTPVVACPPYSSSFAGMDVLSSLRMPSGVAPLVVLEPENAAIATAKIVAMRNKDVRRKVEEYQNEKKMEVEEADREIAI
jgi:5-(carboxyamino)imidazole ribonucleotide mutase